MKVGETTATAARIGNPVSRDKVMREVTRSNGMMNVVSEAMLNEAVAVCGRDGHFVCPQTGIALAGVSWRSSARRSGKMSGWLSYPPPTASNLPRPLLRDSKRIFLKRATARRKLLRNSWASDQVFCSYERPPRIVVSGRSYDKRIMAA
jgi:hypothetical protein